MDESSSILCGVVRKEVRLAPIRGSHPLVTPECLAEVVGVLETAALDSERIILSAKIAKKAGAQFVKTSTGFHPAGGASEAAVALLRDTVGGKLGVKAAGGIRDRETAMRMIAAGDT